MFQHDFPPWLPKNGVGKENEHCGKRNREKDTFRRLTKGKNITVEFEKTEVAREEVKFRWRDHFMPVPITISGSLNLILKGDSKSSKAQIGK